MITDMLKTAAKTGSARALKASGMPVAGKTGTVAEADGNSTRDIWTAAYTPELAAVVWMGYDYPDQTHAMASSEGGSGYPARLCASFLRSVSGELSGKDFKRPRSVRRALVDKLALEETHRALLTTENTPAEYTVEELFHVTDLPQTSSDRWTQPRVAADLRLLTGPGETPVLAFTPREANSEYQLLRTSGGKTEAIAVLSGEVGQEIRFADTGHDLSQSAEYALLPRNTLLFASGTLLTGPQSASVHYAPGGWLNKIMGVGMTEVTQTPTEVELENTNSLFD